ncbi:MAG TPA: allantoate amidohydrolase [Jatrophihabitans sp.]|nr:allantoate amidohydrolase [Jatrophihabitans sp.]
MSFAADWAALQPVGRNGRSGGYRRFAWTGEDATLREWFAAAAAERGLDVTQDRAGNQWAWWGDPDADGPGVVTGSHLDSVPDGGAFDGPLGVVSAFAAVDALRAQGFLPARPIGVANFVDEEGARFGVACAGSRLITGQLAADRAAGLRDGDGISLAEAMSRAGQRPDLLGRDEQALRRIGQYVELHIEQGRGLIELDRPVAVGSSIWPHGRWRLDLPGQANHAGTTRLADRDDPMLRLARVITGAREAAAARDCVATVGKVRVEPNGVNAIPSAVTAWLDARGGDEDAVRAVAAEVGRIGGRIEQESFTPSTAFDPGLVVQVAGWLDGAPVLATGAGHDAGILATAGIPSVMLFVRNPSGISHSPVEHAEPADCQAGVAALTTVLSRLAG